MALPIMSFMVLTTCMLLYSNSQTLISRGICGKQSCVKRRVTTKNLVFPLSIINEIHFFFLSLFSLFYLLSVGVEGCCGT